jgi:hypothetical protein
MQNSIEMATADTAVAATIPASKRVARRWSRRPRRSTMRDAVSTKIAASDARGMKAA